MARWGPLSREEWLHRKRLLEGGANGDICSVEGCLREVFTIADHEGNIVEKFDKCIFHVEKDNKYWIENYDDYKQRKHNEQIPARWNEELIYRFWQKIRESIIIEFDPDTDKGRWGLKTREGCDFSYFVFPAFYYGTDIHAFWDSDDKKVFTDDLDFEEAQFLDKSYFANVEFRGFVDFDKAYFHSEVGFFNVTFHQDVEFDEVIFENGVFFEKVDFNSYINFENVVVRGKVKFTNVNASGYGVFVSSRFGDIEFNRVSANSDLRFENIHMHGRIVLEKTEILGMFYIDKSEFLGSVYLREVEFRNKVMVEDSVFKGDVFIGSPEESSLVDREEKLVVFYDILRVIRTSFMGIVDFSNVEFHNEVHFISSYFDKILNFYRIRLDSILVDFRGCFLGVSSYVVIEDIESLEHQGRLQYGNHRETIAGLRIRFPANSKRFILKNIDFRRFTHICLEGNVEDVQFISVDWGDLSHENYCGEWTGYVPSRRREIYRQHKVSLDRQENYLYARKFYEMEMRMYKESMRERRKANQNIISRWLENALFKFYDETSRFGNSIARPVVFLIITTIFAVIFNRISLTELAELTFLESLKESFPMLLKEFFLVLLMLFPGGMSMSIISIINVGQKPWLWILYLILGYYFVYQFLMAVRNLPRR